MARSRLQRAACERVAGSARFLELLRARLADAARLRRPHRRDGRRRPRWADVCAATVLRVLRSGDGGGDPGGGSSGSSGGGRVAGGGDVGAHSVELTRRARATPTRLSVATSTTSAPDAGRGEGCTPASRGRRARRRRGDPHPLGDAAPVAALRDAASPALLVRQRTRGADDRPQPVVPRGGPRALPAAPAIRILFTHQWPVLMISTAGNSRQPRRPCAAGSTPSSTPSPAPPRSHAQRRLHRGRARTTSATVG